MLKRLLCVITSLIFAAAGNNAYASAGWYPTTPGDYIDVSVCLPKRHGSIIYLQGSNLSPGYKTFVKFKPVLTDDLSYCGKFSREYTYPWKVNAKGGWGLSFYDPLTKKRFYGWPDGIESK